MSNKGIFFDQNACHALSDPPRPLRPRVPQDMLHPMQKRNREYAASLEMQNNGSTTAANGDIKITVIESRDSISLERFDPKGENIRETFLASS